MALPPPVVPLAEVAIIDRAAVELGQDLGVLMAAAGAALAREAGRMAGDGVIQVVCGPGNNGGDGYVAAALLAAAGREVRLWAIEPPRTAEAMAAAARLPPSVKLADAPLASPALLIDAILGAGLRGPLRGPVADALKRLRPMARRVPVLAADVPSGIGSELELPATRTVCFACPKRELIGRPGEFLTADIGLDPRALMEVQPASLLRFPRHQRDGHKGAHGELLVVGGGPFPGALEFACRAALLAGCDLVRAWTCEGPPLPPTVIVHRMPTATLRPADPGTLTPLIARASAVLVGNGLGLGEAALEAASEVVALARELGVPVVLDADGLTAMAGELRSLPPGGPPLLLTPHHGEARGLLGRAVDDEAVHAYARPDRVVLLKGRVDLISDGWRWQRNPRGNARLAVGGTGDLLAGLAAGLMARGCEPFDAARMAVLWLTTCGDELWPELGPCYDPLDLLQRLPRTLRGLMEPRGWWPPG